MHRSVRRQVRTPMFHVGLTAAVLAAGWAGGTAFAGIPSRDGVIHACYGDKGGALRVIDTEGGGSKCDSNEKPLDWGSTNTGQKGTGRIYVRTSAKDADPAVAQCDKGDIATGGGGSVNTDPPGYSSSAGQSEDYTDNSLVTSLPARAGSFAKSDETPDGWIVLGSKGRPWAMVVCMDVAL